MLELRSVSKRYSGIAAVKDVSFIARAGEVTGCLGPNGSGKSTTLKMITGLIDPSEGQILFHGEPIEKDRIAYRQRLGYVPEEPQLYPHLTGAEYLEMVGQLRGLPDRLLADKVDGRQSLRKSPLRNLAGRSGNVRDRRTRTRNRLLAGLLHSGQKGCTGGSHGIAQAGVEK
jgi:ABC-2 type transport system ATP-binding protein